MTSLSPDTECRSVLERFPAACRLEGVEYLHHAGGFSGARFWRLSTPQGRLCLRRWPTEYPDSVRLSKIHQVLEHVFRAGFTLVPVPLRTSDGLSFIQRDTHLWELTPWLTGHADYLLQPSRAKLTNAAQTLARFHKAAATCPGAGGSPQSSPGLEQRHERLLRLLRGDAESIRRWMPQRCWSGLPSRAVAILDLFRSLAPEILTMLDDARHRAVRLQPCIRDIWHDHVLFEGDQVSGLIDFGAMRTDSVAGDIARLFASLVGDDPMGWQTALSAYESVRPLSDTERSLIVAFDRSTVLLSGMNWLEWICVEQREFEGHEEILARLDVTIERLRHLISE